MTAEKMGLNYVSGIAVNGIPVTGKGSVFNIVGGNNTSVKFDDLSNTLTIDAAASSSSSGKGGDHYGT